MSGLAIKLGENPDLGAQHLRNDRHRNVVDGAHFVGAQAVHVGQMDGRNEDDRGALKARVFADHRGQLKAIEFRHAHVDENNRDFVLEELFERLSGRRGLDEVLAQLGQDRLVTQQLGWLIVDQQDIDLVVRSHFLSPPLAMQPHAQRR